VQDLKSAAQREKVLLDNRRRDVWELYSTGKSLTQIAEIWHVDVSTVSRDIDLIIKQNNEKQDRLLEEVLPLKHRMRMAAMDKAIKELWTLCYAEQDSRRKESLLNSITDTYIKQAAIDSDSVPIGQALKKIAKIKELVKEQEIANST
jgi:DNA-binding CsgD family transcriptional regulator